MYSSIDKTKFENATSFTIRRSYDSVNKYDKESAQLLKKAIEIREKYLTFENHDEVYPKHYNLTNQSTTKDTKRVLKMNKGVFEINDQIEIENNTTEKPIMTIHEYTQFMKDYKYILGLCENQSVIYFCKERLNELSKKYTLHNLLNAQKRDTSSTEDIHTISKVDTHIHAAACMTESQLLEFIKEKGQKDQKEIVRRYTDEKGEKKEETLEDLFRRLKIDLNNFSMNQLRVRAGYEFFNRFDVFNASYKIAGEDMLRTVFLKAENIMEGKYFAELIKQVFEQLNGTSTRLELRLSV